MVFESDISSMSLVEFNITLSPKLLDLKNRFLNTETYIREKPLEYIDQNSNESSLEY